jgi:hypothetical protein
MTAPTYLDEHDDDLAVTPAATVKGVGLFARLAESEPVRLYLGGLFAAVVALLVGLGVLTDTQGALWGVRSARPSWRSRSPQGIRSQVYSPRTVAALQPEAAA